MGGGKMTRPGFDQPQASDAFAETEFYRLLLTALEEKPVLTLPGCWVRFKPPADAKLYAEDMEDCCKFFSAPTHATVQVFEPGAFRVAYSTLHALPGGRPTALLFTEENTRRTLAMQLQPPLLCEAPPPVPDSPAALTLQLSFADLEQVDADPAALGRALRDRTEGKNWLRSPQIDRWTERALSLAQRDYDRRRAEARRSMAPWERR